MTSGQCCGGTVCTICYSAGVPRRFVLRVLAVSSPLGAPILTPSPDVPTRKQYIQTVSTSISVVENTVEYLYYKEWLRDRLPRCMSFISIGHVYFELTEMADV
jgi:hypothetical protein